MPGDRLVEMALDSGVGSDNVAHGSNLSFWCLLLSVSPLGYPYGV